MKYNITYRRKDKGWQYIISVKEKDGKWKQKASEQGFGTKGAAKTAGDDRWDKLKEELKEELEKEGSVSDEEEYKSITYEEFIEIFLKYLELHREGNTVKTFKSALLKFNKLNPIEMTKIKFANIQDCVNDMVKEGMEISSIEHYLIKLNVFFNAAKKPYEILTENPLDGGKILLQKIKLDKMSKKNKALTESALNDLLSKMKPEADYIICLLASHCGLRAGEIAGLCDTDIDLTNRRIPITKQWKILKDGTFGFGSVKSDERVVPIPISIVPILRTFLNNNVKRIDRRLFPWTTTAICCRLSYKIKNMGYDNSLHDLRHTYGTRLIFNGVDIKTVAILMGDSVETIIRNYLHYNDDMEQSIMDKINQIY